MRSLSPVARWAFAIAAAVFTSGAASGTIDYQFLPIPGTAAGASKPVSKYRFLYGDDASWPGAIRWSYNHHRAPEPFAGDPAGTLAQIRAALDSWTQVCGVTYVYEGETTIAPHTLITDRLLGRRPDNVNVVGWDVLGANIAGITSAWYDGATRELSDSDISLSIDLVTTAAAMRRTARHEWGHALGLAHSDVNGQLMSGPPESAYNFGATMQRDDIRGCRCLYGGAVANPAGFACALPHRIDFGFIPVGSASAPRAITVTNDGNAPLKINNVLVDSVLVARSGSCSAGLALAPGQSCDVSLVAHPALVVDYADTLTIYTSDGPYVVELAYSGNDGSVPPVVRLVEFFHGAFGHYLITHLADEITRLDNGTFAGWTRTGRSINAWTSPTAGSVAVCRFFSEKFAPKSSHFYTSFASECQLVKADASWSFEGVVFQVQLPDALGHCAAGTQRVFRLYNNGQSGAPNHRFTTDTALRAQMIAQGWVPEGSGDGVTMCAPM